MLEYIVRRLAFSILSILGVTLMLFIIMYQLPGDPARVAAGPGAGSEQVQAVREKLGLDEPLHIQYLTYMRNLLRGDLGVSIATRKPVLLMLRQHLPASFELMLVAMLLNLMIAVPLGVFSALRPGRLADNLSRLFAALGMGMPTFWVALMAQLVFYGRWGLLPARGRLSPRTVAPDARSGFVFIDMLLARDLSILKEALAHLIMPAVVLALPQIAVISRIMRNSMLDELGEAYVRAARGKGLSRGRVIWIHVFKNAVMGPLTMAGMQIGWMLGGALLVESVFSWPGVGFLAFNAIYKRDFPVTMGVTLVIGITFVLSSLVVDVLHSYVDPRIRD